MPFTGDSSDDSSDGEGDHGGSGVAILGTADSSTNTRATNSSSEHTDTSLSGGSASSPSKSAKTTSSLSPAKRSSSGSPSKCKTRGNICLSYFLERFAYLTATFYIATAIQFFDNNIERKAFQIHRSNLECLTITPYLQTHFPVIQPA